MNSILLSLSATALGLSLLCGAVSLREKVRVKRRTWAVLGTATFIVAGVVVLVTLGSDPYVPLPMVWVAGALLLVGLIFWIALFALNRSSGDGLGLVAVHLKFAGRVALPDWESLDTKELRATDRSDASHINQIVNVGAVLVIVPGIALVLAASILMNVRGNQTSDFLSHAVGFYTLLIATCWTAAYVLTIAATSLMQVLRGNGGGITLPKVAISLGTWAGCGAAAGVFVGALIPLVVVPLSTGEFHLLGMALLDTVSPSLLLDISTAGAVYGFLIGEVVSVVSISAREKNLYIRSVLPPLMFAVTSSLLGLAGLTPGALSKALSTEYSKTMVPGKSGEDPFTTALTQGLDTQYGWAHVVAGLDQHGWNQVVDHHVFFVLTWVAAILVAAFTLIIGIRKREMELLNLPPRQEPAPDPKSS